MSERTGSPFSLSQRLTPGISWGHHVALHQGFRWIIQSYPGYAQTILKGEVGEQRERMNDNLRVD